MKMEFKVNPRAGKELAKEMKKNARKKGIELELDEKQLQRTIEKVFKKLT